MDDLSAMRRRYLDEIREAVGDIESATEAIPMIASGDPFTDDEQARLEAALERLQKASIAVESWATGVAVRSKTQRLA